MKNTTPDKEREWEKVYSKMKARKERALLGMCATCGSKLDHNEPSLAGSTFTHQFDYGLDTAIWSEVDFIREIEAKAREEERADFLAKLKKKAAEMSEGLDSNNNPEGTLEAGRAAICNPRCHDSSKEIALTELIRFFDSPTPEVTS